MRNLLTILKTNLLKYLNVGGKVSENNSEYLQVMYNHMKNTGGTPKEKWVRVKNILIDPMTIIPLTLGLIFSILTIIIPDSEITLKTICTVITAIGLGVGINHFTFFYKKEVEEQTLKFKAETTVRQLNSLINKILNDVNIKQNDKNILIDDILNSIDYWKDYYPNADTELIKKLKHLRETSNTVLILNQLKSLEIEASTSGLSSYIPLSGGTFNYGG